jgi:hypothetical protein
MGASVCFLGGLMAGCLMMLFGSGLLGAGDGTYLPLALASAPLGFLGYGGLLVGAPIAWAALGTLCGMTRDGYINRTFPVALGIHYATGIYLVSFGEFADWGYFWHALRAIPVTTLTWAAVYLGGHAAMWFLYLTRPR